jgi:uncharacterized cupin superfamily protein
MEDCVNISSIIPIGAEGCSAFVPSLDSYQVLSDSWIGQEFHSLKRRSNHVTVGYWTGEPGRARIEPWPYIEICVIKMGRVAVADNDGCRREFGPGDSFIVPKGFVGEWVTLETATKVFIAVE